MRDIILMAVALAGCGSANRTDGVTQSEAAGLNQASEKLDSAPTGETAPQAR